jgi:pimeloyl-ACP methyl ester carboxylesterase
VPVTHRTVEANGIRLHVAEAGTGPLVLLLHGWPELWYSYRHQLEALADAGYHAVAPDQRGYGRSDAPEDVAAYTLCHLAGDAVAVADALGADRFAVVGHDWGSPVASTVGLFRPDRVRGVALLSVPYTPRGSVDQLTGLTRRLGPHNYQAYFQQPGVAEAALEADVRASVVTLLVGLSGSTPRRGLLAEVTTAADLVPDLGDVSLPPWLTEDDVAVYVAEHGRAGFRGGLNWYRNARRNWELLAAWHRAPLLVPSLFVGGDRDPVLAWPGFADLVASLREYSMPGLTRAVVLEGCGHWTEQERPDEVNGLLVEFLAGLPA